MRDKILIGICFIVVMIYSVWSSEQKEREDKQKAECAALLAKPKPVFECSPGGFTCDNQYASSATYAWERCQRGY